MHSFYLCSQIVLTEYFAILRKSIRFIPVGYVALSNMACIMNDYIKILSQYWVEPNGKFQIL